MSEAIKIASDALSERARLKKGGECVRYAAIAIQALEDAGYRVVKQEQVGYAVDMSTGGRFLGDEKAIGNHGWAPTPERRVWRDLP